MENKKEEKKGQSIGDGGGAITHEGESNDSKQQSGTIAREKKKTRFNVASIAVLIVTVLGLFCCTIRTAKTTKTTTFYCTGCTRLPI